VFHDDFRAVVCSSHGGAAPQVRARAAVRDEVFRWGLGNVDVDPGETLLKLVAQSAARLASHRSSSPNFYGWQKLNDHERV
jgi:hypothetical protein